MDQTKRAVQDYLARHRPEDVQLVLDSTGPSLTKHYLALDAIGAEVLGRFKSIHTFSGGTFAYFGYLAASQNKCRHPLPEYYRNLDREMRKAHTEAVPVVPLLVRYLRHKRFYNSASPIESVIRYVFDDASLNAPSKSIADNFSAYYASHAAGEKGIVRFSNAGAPLEGIDTVFDVIRYAVNIPFLYGKNSRLSDPAFHQDYRRALKAINAGDQPALVITPWKSGERGNTLYLNPFAPANQKLVMSRDILCLLLNIPNPTYGRDLKAIFG